MNTLKLIGSLVISVIVLALLFFAWSFTRYQVVRPDEEAVVISLYRTADPILITKPGRYHVGYGKELIRFPVRLQNIDWNDENNLKFQDSKSLSLQANASAQIYFKRGAALEAIKKYGVNAPDRIGVQVDKIVRQAVTDNAGQFGAMEIVGPKRAVFQKVVSTQIKRELDREGVTVDNFMFTGQFILPTEVKQAIDAAQKATQIAIQRENELRTVQAESAKLRVQADTAAYVTVAKAKAEAQANTLKSNSINDKLIRYISANKWDGKLPTTQLGSGTDVMVPLK